MERMMASSSQSRLPSRRSPVGPVRSAVHPQHLVATPGSAFGLARSAMHPQPLLATPGHTNQVLTRASSSSRRKAPGFENMKESRPQSTRQQSEGQDKQRLQECLAKLNACEDLLLGARKVLRDSILRDSVPRSQEGTSPGARLASSPGTLEPEVHEKLSMQAAKMMPPPVAQSPDVLSCAEQVSVEVQTVTSFSSCTGGALLSPSIFSSTDTLDKPLLSSEAAVEARALLGHPIDLASPSPSVLSPTMSLRESSRDLKTPLQGTATREMDQVDNLTIPSELDVRVPESRMRTPPTTGSLIAEPTALAKQQTKSQNFLVDQILLATHGIDEARDSCRITSRESGDPPTSGKRHGPYWMNTLWGLARVPMFHPEHPFILSWECVGFLFLVYLCFSVPVYVSFDIVPSGMWYTFTSGVDIYFMCDVLVNLLVAYKDDEGKVVYKPDKVAMMYLRHWLLPDIFAAIPWDWLTSGDQMAQFSKGVRIMKITRVTRVARLVRLIQRNGFSDHIEMATEASSMLTFVVGILKCLFTLFSIVHWAACAWYMVGTLDTDGPTWLKMHAPVDADLTQLYTYSVYFTLTTMTTVGYGDISPQNFTEVTFVLVLLVIASVVFASLMGTLTDLIGNLNSDANIIREKKRMLSQYMGWRHVPTSLFKSVREHLLFLWEENAGYDTFEQEMKTMLTPVLQKELSFHIYGKLLKEAPFLSWMRNYDCCLRDLANKLHSLFLSSGDFVFRMGEVNDQAYILLHGTVHMTQNESLYSASLNPKCASGWAPSTEDEDDENVSIMLTMAQQLETAHRGSAVSNGPIKNDGKAKAAANVFRSAILDAATDGMKSQDTREHAAALRLQRRWRRKQLRAKAARRVSVFKNVASRTVDAPAYFGERCFWTEFDSWDTDDPLKYSYSARCDTRVELVCISKDVVKEVAWANELYRQGHHPVFTMAALSIRVIPTGRRFWTGSCSRKGTHWWVCRYSSASQSPSKL